MRLDLLYEGQGQSINHNVFHGFKTYKQLLSVLDNGTHQNFYVGDLETALGFSLDYWGHGGREENDNDAYVIEILLNINNQDIKHDEDFLSRSIGEYPGGHRKGLSSYNIPKDKHRKFKKAFGWNDRDPSADLSSGEGDYDSARELARTVRKQRSVWDTTRWGQLAQLTKPIGIRGRSRITGAYIFTKEDPSDSLFSAGRNYACSKIIYNRGGSIKLSQASKASTM